MKFSYDDTTKPIMESGVINEPGADATQFCKPSDVAVLKNGFVADGYCNSRLVKLD